DVGRDFDTGQRDHADARVLQLVAQDVGQLALDLVGDAAETLGVRHGRTTPKSRSFGALRLRMARTARGFAPLPAPRRPRTGPRPGCRCSPSPTCRTRSPPSPRARRP